MAGKGRHSNNPRSASSDVAEGHLTASVGVADQQTPRLSPYERMRGLLAARTDSNGALEISTVDDLQSLLKENPKPDRIRLRLKLLWISSHQYKQLTFVRLHFIDADAPEPLSELQKTFRDNYDDAETARDVDTLLFTATAWNVGLEDPHLPPPGAIVQISNFSNLGLFRELQCQATIRLANLAWS